MRRALRLGAAAMIAATILVATGQPAQANIDTTSMANCVAGATPNSQSAVLGSANVLTPYDPPFGIFQHDAFRLTMNANDYYFIDYWLTRKYVSGELPVAPSGWPAPGERRYMGIARVNQGNVWVPARSRFYLANQWFPVGLDSGCILYHGPNSGTLFTFSVNDTNISDNNGWNGTLVDHWW